MALKWQITLNTSTTSTSVIVLFSSADLGTQIPLFATKIRKLQIRVEIQRKGK